MMKHPLRRPQVLAVQESLQSLLTSSNFLSNHVWSLTFSPCSKYLAFPQTTNRGDDVLIVVRCSDWYSSSSCEIQSQWFCSNPVWSLAFIQSGKKFDSTSMNESRVNRRYDLTTNLFLAAGLTKGEINIWNVDTSELILVLVDHQLTVSGLVVTSSSMQLASCSHDKTIKLWNLLDDGNMYRTVDQWIHPINTVKWSPNDRYLCAVGAYGTIVVYETKTWKRHFQLIGHLNNAIDCSFSSDSALLATASFDTRVLLWSTVTGELLREYPHMIPKPLKIIAGGLNNKFVRSVQFSKFNNYLISICDDQKLRWLPVESTSKREIETKDVDLLSLSISSNGETIAGGRDSGGIYLCSTLFEPCPSLKQWCRMLINRNKLNVDDLYLVYPHLISYLHYRDEHVK